MSCYTDYAVLAHHFDSYDNKYVINLILGLHYVLSVRVPLSVLAQNCYLDCISLVSQIAYI